ncbi:MAG: SurA N-terminal domain-containing protein [Desulfobacterales bacterium]|jgi:parvulin-like peptidyl-prolyl isomerase
MLRGCFYWGAAAVVFALIGCSGHDTGTGDEYLIRIGERVVTVADFNRAFEIAKTAYSHNSLQNPEDTKDAQLRLLNQMTEELVLLQRAGELGIGVSDEELEKAIEKIRADFPDDAFEQTLLEYAVSYKSWKSGLKTRLLMEKLVQQELKDETVIQPDEVAKFYEENYNNDATQSGDTRNPAAVEEIIVKQLRRVKIENAYRNWIENLRKRYTIDINKDQWNKILAAPS